MIKIPTTKTDKRNKTVLRVLAVWFAIVTLGFSWIAFKNHEYRAQFSTYKTEVNNVLSTANQSLLAVKDSEDPLARAVPLKELAQKLEEKQTQAPLPPALFGVHLGTDAEFRQQARITESAGRAAGDLRAIAHYIEFQRQTTVSLQLLSLKSATNHEQIVELAGAWQQVAASVEEVEPSVHFKEPTLALGEKIKIIQQIIAQLGELYKANDEQGFAAKKNSFVSAINDLQAVGQQFAEKAKALDADLAENMARLRQNLK